MKESSTSREINRQKITFAHLHSRLFSSAMDDIWYILKKAKSIIEMKFDFLMNFRNSQFSIFIPWIPKGPWHNLSPLDIVN